MLIICTGMNNIKYANDRQEKYMYRYKNITEKLHKTNADIWFIKMYKTYNVTHNSRVRLTKFLKSWTDMGTGNHINNM
jgi:hypothetical protein